jgi:hypothetical protein
MLKALQPYFNAGTYDLLRKNCNCFTDCALFYLLGQRLDQKYRSLEKVGAAADQYVALIRGITGGTYQPNPRADNFSSCLVVEKLKPAGPAGPLTPPDRRRKPTAAGHRAVGGA